ncbi:MFS transporter [Streptomyces noursei ZPM]|uniref:MFS transporter n=1 Tax=Streptomyces noursei TaxID=1971 RepID=A0A401QYA0_STRNR|nr:MFS transporter [Streptomyces noursei]AKA03000.1 MFS transporter [Streptomyces noursei ZPM]EOS99743.1 MFS transporter [Streptomyces noursei CCRC 11814]EXU89957.1 MFS transporter [Streptomyces noursei PD-1]UWS71519.1 MFS transporter [Streptomyces noursei]GCB90345.1 MFS transporter [Streptomyces noursei]
MTETSPAPERRGTADGTRVAARLDRLPPSRWHRKVTLLVGIGAFFDLYEIFLGGVLAAVLAEQWGLGPTAKSAVIAAGFLGMFVGANVLSVLADRLGRRRMFLVNLGGYAFFSLAAAAAPDLGWLLALRFLAGLGLGAELVLVDTYLAEFLPRAVRGRYLAHAYTLGFVGVPVAALLGARLVAGHPVLGVDGWRWLLVVGALGAAFIQLMRRHLPESPRWLSVHGRSEEADRIVTDIERRVVAETGISLPSVPDTTDVPERRVPLGAMFRGEQRRRTVMWWIFQVLQTVGYYGFGSLAPVVLTAKGHTVTDSLLYAALSYCGYPLGSALSVPLIDRIERRTLIVAAALGIAGCGLAFGFATATWAIVTFGVLLTVCSNVFSNAFHVYQTEIFPTGLRSSAIGIAYSLSRLTSVVLPFVALGVLADLGAPAVFAGSAVLMVLLCLDVVLLGPRSTGRSLERI